MIVCSQSGLPSRKDLVILLELDPLLHPLQANNLDDVTTEVTFELETIFSVHELEWL